jgi:hypothetical protein
MKHAASEVNDADLGISIQAADEQNYILSIYNYPWLRLIFYLCALSKIPAPSNMTQLLTRLVLQGINSKP